MKPFSLYFRNLGIFFVFTALLILGFRFSTAQGQGTTAFTYQGQLRDSGTNASGTYTMIFKLYDAVTSGAQVGSAITNNAVLANGLFTVNLDFGAGGFNGNARWLDITITNSSVTQTLSPRVQVLPVPYAQFAAVAGSVPGGAINASNIASGQVVKNLNGLADSAVISAGANVSLFTNGNALQVSASVPNIQLFRSVTNATFVVPTNVTRIMVEMWGSGGGGGGGNSGGGTIGGGGGGGAYAWNVFTVVPGTSYLVTAGSGGSGGSPGGGAGAAGATSSFGALLTAGGGSGGGGATGGGNGTGGTGGTNTGSLANAPGSGGDINGNGGGVWRGGGVSLQSGNSGSGPGSGGSGGGPGPPSGTGRDGNSGAVIVYY